MGASDERVDRDDEVRFGAFERAIADRQDKKHPRVVAPNCELKGRGFVLVPQVNCAEQAASACSPLSPIKHCKSKLRGEQAKQGSKWKTDDGGITILDGFCRRQPRIKTLSSF